MKPKPNRLIDVKSLIRYYQERGYCISYPQIRAWEKAGIIHSSRIGLRKKVFSFLDVYWVGVACLLRLAGKRLSSIKEMRLATNPRSPFSPRIRNKRLLELASLLERQQGTARMLRTNLPSPTGGPFRPDGRPYRPDVVTVKDNSEVEFTEYKIKVLDKNTIMVKVIRAAHNLSQSELAEKLGFSQARLSQIENGWIKPDEKEKNRIAKVLDEKVGVLFPN